MEINKLLEQLLEKARREQAEYKAWLLTLPPEKILNEAYEYTVREDILLAMEDVHLTDKECFALLECRFPLTDIFKEYTSWETGYMDDISASIQELGSRYVRESEERHGEAR